MFADVFRAPIICMPIVNHDNNQHAANENLRLQNLWDGINTYASLMAGLNWKFYQNIAKDARRAVAAHYRARRAAVVQAPGAAARGRDLLGKNRLLQCISRRARSR